MMTTPVARDTLAATVKQGVAAVSFKTPDATV